MNRPSTITLLWVAVLFLGSRDAAAAQIHGKVVLLGRPPAEIPVDLTSFPECRGVLKGKELTTCHYVVDRAGGLANVFVYIKEGLAGRSFAAPTNTLLLEERDCGFHPYVMGLRTNQSLLIRNAEPFLDTVMAAPVHNPAFNYAQPAGTTVKLSFPQPEVLVKVRCAVHPWEFAFLGVVEHPFFAVTATNGAYRLPPGLPAGRYVIEAVHPKLGRQAHAIAVDNAQPQTVSFAFAFQPPASKQSMHNPNQP